VLVALMATLIFGSPEAEQFLWRWLFFLDCVTLPVMLLLAAVLPWIAYRREHYWLAMGLAGLPFLNGAMFLLVLLIGG
jgi:hypothetical protein